VPLLWEGYLDRSRSLGITPRSCLLCFYLICFACAYCTLVFFFDIYKNVLFI